MSDAAMTALVAYSWPGNVRELENVIERLMVGAPGPVIDVEHLPNEIRVGDPVTLRQKCDRRRAVAYDLYRLMRDQHQSFWSTIHPLFVKHDITRATVRDVVRLGLEDARGNYRILARLFNLEPKEYRGFRNFLREYDCDIPLNAGSRSAWSGRRPGGDGSSASHADVEVAGY
jgi:DNA-binding NtrC family response regulator